MRLAPLLVAVAVFTPVSRATTWDEPWHETVVRNADAFVRGRVLEADRDHARIKVVKRLGGVDVADTVTVDRFGQLHLTSATVGRRDDERKFPFVADREYYLFLEKVKEHDGWAIATPTTGFAAIKDGNVYATYRHSYHQALVPEDLYEQTMVAIFKGLHGQEYDRASVREVVRTYLTKPPASAQEPGGDREAMDLFFRQHVALECVYYLGDESQFELLEPFVSSKSDHVQISAARALSRVDTPVARDRLWKVVVSDGSGFARVMALWGLKRLNAREYLPKLEAFVPQAPEEPTGFGGNLMDPRIGTSFPRTLKQACRDLVTEWQRPNL